ncbi:MAG: putative addiction module antidote protein [Gammaproteobacteria bacterium]|nr:putative addiction module antidote protein [Gammaproteobacteria bacterium]
MPFRAADHLKTDAERAAYLEALLEDGDSRALTLGLRDLAESAGGMAVIAERTGLSRETLYRTLSAKGNPRLDTLSALLHAMGLRLSVTPTGAAAH